MTGYCTEPDIHSGVILTNPNATYSTDYALRYECKRGHELVAGNLTQVCVESGDWLGAPPECRKDKSHSDDDDDMTVSYVAIGIVLGSIVVLVILAIDFSFHIKRRLRSKRYQKRRQAREMGHAPSHKRPVPFFVTSQSHSGLTNRGFGFSDELGNYPTDSEFQNGPPLGRLPPLVTSDTRGSTKKKKKKKQIYPECLNASPVSDQETKPVSKTGKKKVKKKKSTMETSTNYENDASHVDKHAYSGEYNNNDRLMGTYENHAYHPAQSHASHPHTHAHQVGTAPTHASISAMPVYQNSAARVPDHGHSDSGNSSKGYPHALEALDTYDHDPGVKFRGSNMHSHHEQAGAFPPQFFPQDRQIEKSRLKMKAESGNDIHLNQISGSRPLPPVPVVKQPQYPQPMQASIEIHGASYEGVPV